MKGDAVPARATHEPSPDGLGHSVGVPIARPTRNAVRLEAAAELAAACAEWDMGEQANAACIDGWKNALARCSLNDNGYELARDLERYHGVSPDSELVEILDSASSYVWTAHDKAVKAWVAENNIQPTLKAGDRIAYREWVGVVNGIDTGLARYLLKPDGEEERYRNGGGICVPYEDAQAMEAGTGETEGLDAKRDSAVPQGCAQTPGENPWPIR